MNKSYKSITGELILRRKTYFGKKTEKEKGISWKKNQGKIWHWNPCHVHPIGPYCQLYYETILRSWWFHVSLALYSIFFLLLQSEALILDVNLTRQEVTTFLRQPVNLGCYTTTTSAGSILEYSWTKDNQTVTQSPNVQAFDGVLVVTPEKDSDFGTYECNVTNGMSSGLCRISLVQVTSTPGKHRE